ncbi:SAGA-associated factor 29 isoform X1 [Saimiri boliviensis]|uniref:SAGA-associated factor 29 isoform X1 n=1 Tax=Saimiri boliviensis TaxID=27679 RepID=UPI00193D66EA|nr:SAGA-associated factor 29 isoform X1 [Saimiri boliviensis boliviensis]XP_039333932.1 SAGA-associated factor 29 isoform X1 [Saimiri boliviensis boliviensis]
MALVSADSRIAELLTELHQLIKQTQEERSRSEHNLVNIQKTHERMQTENKISPYYRTKLRGLYTTAKADAEAECNILRKALDKIAEIKSLLEERRIAAKIAGLYNDSEPPRKTMRRGVLMTLLQQSAMTLPLWIGKPGDKPPPLCGAIPASGDYVARPGDKVAARVKAVDGDEQWILAEVVSYSHATNKYEVDDIDEEGKERHTLSRRRVIPLPQWKANPETDPEALFQKEQLVLALYPQTTCFYRALIHAPPQRVKQSPVERPWVMSETGSSDRLGVFSLLPPPCLHLTAPKLTGPTSCPPSSTPAPKVTVPLQPWQPWQALNQQLPFSNPRRSSCEMGSSCPECQAPVPWCSCPLR